MGRFGRFEAVAWCAAGLLGGTLLRGQTHKVARPESVVRAVGVYEWTGDLTKPTGVRLVPVTIFVDGQVQDAGVYLARPVPLALDQGTLYELDDAGASRGLVDVKVARHVQIPAGANLTPYDDGWFGYGTFQAPPVAKVLPAKKPTQNVAVNGKAGPVEDGDHSRTATNNRDKDGRATDDADGPVPGSPEDVKVDAGRTDKDDVDRPTLRRRPPVDAKEAKKERKERDSASVVPTAKSLNDDPDRPTMKRGSNAASEDVPPLNGLPADMRQMIAVSDAKRREPHPFAREWEDEAEHQAVLAKMRAMAEAQLVAYGPVPAGADTTSAGAAAVAGVPGKGGVGAAAGRPGVQDTSAGSPPVLRRNQVAADAAAKEQVTAEATPRGRTDAAGLGSAGARSAGTGLAGAGPVGTVKAGSAGGDAAVKRVVGGSVARRAAGRGRWGSAAPASSGPLLLEEQVKGYVLSYGGAPVYVYTAHTAGTGAGLRYVTVVAQADGVNSELKMALQGVTDAAHLDRQPWMRFVDVVDAEASNRASLLFEMRGQTARQFALYRVIGGKADPLFMGGTTQ